MNKFLQNVWFEKYRPQTLSDIVLDEKILTRFQEFKRKGDIGNLLFIGQPGLGKTSLAKIVVSDVLDCQYRYINASDENGIDTIRTKVNDFVSIKSFDGKLKVVILDEADGLTKSGQDALRNLMESRLDNARFILTANYGHKISDAIKSRCQSFDLTYDKKSYVKRIVHILNSENIAYKADKVVELCKIYYPDFRKCINELQQNTIDNTLDLSFDPILGFVAELLNKLPLDIEDIRKYYLNNESRFNGDYENLLVGIYDCFCDKSIDQVKKMEAILIVADALKTHSMVSNPEINFYATLIKLKKLF